MQQNTYRNLWKKSFMAGMTHLSLWPKDTSNTSAVKQTRWASCSKTCPSNRKFTRYNLHHLWILFYVNTFLSFSAHEKLNELSFLITVSGVVVNISMDSYKRNISQDPIFCSQLFFFYVLILRHRWVPGRYFWMQPDLHRYPWKLQM